VRASERQQLALPMVPESGSRTPSIASTKAPSPAGVTLPGDLSGSLKYLDDAQLQRLCEAVTEEIDRRNKTARRNQPANLAGYSEARSRGKSATHRNNRGGGSEEIPEGRANLIRASFKAGIKPAAIARMFRISRSLVNRVLSSGEKPEREVPAAKIGAN
jgi:hypothetical protein